MFVDRYLLAYQRALGELATLQAIQYDFDAQQHPRGNPKNKGQFAKKGTSSGGSTATAATPQKPPKVRKLNQRRAQHNPPQPQPAPPVPAPDWKAPLAEVGKKIIAKASQAENEAGLFLLAQVNKVPEPVQGWVAATMQLLETPKALAQGLVQRVAQERGGTPEDVEQTATIVAVADEFLDTALDAAEAFVEDPASVFLPASADENRQEKVSSAIDALKLSNLALPINLVPWGSLAYLAYATVTNPLATLRAVKGAIKDVKNLVSPDEPEKPLEERDWLPQSLLDEETHFGRRGLPLCYGQVPASLIATILQRMNAAGNSDLYQAAVLASMDETKSLSRALALADAVVGHLAQKMPKNYERVDYGKHQFSSTQLNLSCAGYSRSQGSPLPLLQQFARAIADEDLASDGREEEQHITVKYGLHTNDPEEVRRLVTGFGPFEVTLGAVTLFPAKEPSAQRGGEQYDVVKVEVESEDLRRLNALLSANLPHTDTHPEYKPHLTLAYVKPGKGQQYITAEAPFTGMVMDFGTLTFSNHDGEHTIIPLSAGVRYERDCSPLNGETVSAHYEAKHAPKGGIDIAGKHFQGGEWIPSEVVAQATPEQKARIESGGGAAPAPKSPAPQPAPRKQAAAPASASAGKAAQPPGQQLPLAQEHHDAIAAHAQQGEQLNAALRSGQVPEQLASAHHHLQDAFAQTPPFPKPVPVLRGMFPDHASNPETAQKMQQFLGAMQAAKDAGATIGLKGYTSATTAQKPPAEDTSGVLLKIAAVHGLDVTPESAGGASELLLNHNAQFRVGDITAGGGRSVVPLQQVPPTEQQDAKDAPSLGDWHGEQREANKPESVNKTVTGELKPLSGGIGSLDLPGQKHQARSHEEMMQLASSATHQDWTTGRHVKLTRQNGGDDGVQDYFHQNQLVELGYAEKPQVVAAEDLDAALKEGASLLYRGWVDESHANAYRTGTLFGGRGIFGNGTYMAYDTPGSSQNLPKQTHADNPALNVADNYAGTDGKGVITRAVLSKDARIGNYEDIRAEQQAFVAHIDSKIKALGWTFFSKAKAQEKQRLENLKKLYSGHQFNLGRFASLAGYDAIRVPEEGFVSVLNRGKVMMESVNHQQSGGAV